MTVRRKWHIKDKFVLIWVVLKLCQQRGTTDIKMVSGFIAGLYFHLFN